MIPYIIVNIIIILLAALCYGIMPNTDTGTNGGTNFASRIFIVLSFIELLIIAGLRGDFTSDYKNYADIYKYINQYTFIDVFRLEFSQEKGYVLLNKLIGVFTNHVVVFMIIISFIYLLLFYLGFKKQTSCFWLTVLLFVNIGSYYTSFNIMRQILAVSIVFAASKYLYNKSIIKYMMVVIIASFIHTTAIIMIPFYFLLNWKLDKKRIILLASCLIGCFLFLDIAMMIAVKLGFERYSNYANGVFSFGLSKANITSIVIPAAVLFFVVFHQAYLDFNNRIHRIWFNATIFYTFFSILGLKVFLLQRFSEFFSPFVVLMLTYMITSVKDKYLKTIYILIVVTLLIAFNYIALSGTGYDPFYFFWSK